MTSSNDNMAVAVYDRHDDAEAAVKALQLAGFDMKKVSIVGKDYAIEEHVVGYLNAGDRAKIFGKFGALWGGLMGILFGSALMFMPVVGHVIVLGPLAAALVGALEGAAAVGALTALGVPKNSVLRYETALKAGKFMLVVHGDAQDLKRAADLLRTSGYVSLDDHAPQNPAGTAPVMSPQS